MTLGYPIPFITQQRYLFIRHDGFAKGVNRLDVFADCLAEGDTLEEAARRAGYRWGSAHYLKKKLADRLGSQAK